MIRSIFSILTGLAAAFLVIYGVEILGHALYPVVSEPDFNDPEALNKFVASLPAGALLFVILSWGLGSLVGGFFAGLIAGKYKIRFALLVGLILMVSGVVNLVMIPHPAWFWIAGLSVFLPCVYGGAKIAIALSGTDK